MKIIRPITPLHRRMLEDMQIRNYSPHTIEGYLRYVGQFAKHFGVSPDQLGPEHIRSYQLRLLHKRSPKASSSRPFAGYAFSTRPPYIARGWSSISRIRGSPKRYRLSSLETRWVP